MTAVKLPIGKTRFLGGHLQTYGILARDQPVLCKASLRAQMAPGPSGTEVKRSGDAATLRDGLLASSLQLTKEQNPFPLPCPASSFLPAYWTFGEEQHRNLLPCYP